MKTLRRPSAFTLIELLIVVAIIAILAAIALPNLLQAQTRSKVSRVKSDLRTISTALESYAVDNNAYPFVNNTFQGFSDRTLLLTTPISYISTVPADPFRRKSDTYGGFGSEIDPTGRIYLYHTGNALVGSGVTDPTSELRSGWSLTSGGPNLTIDFPYWPFAQTFTITGQYRKFIYDPTNGAVSDGDIFRRGGRLGQPLPEVDNQ